MPTGYSDPQAQFGTGPGGYTIPIIPETHFGLDGLGDATLADLVEYIPFIYHDAGSDHLRFDTGSFAGFGMTGEIYANFTFGLNLVATLDLGTVQAEASVDNAFVVAADIEGNGNGDYFTNYLLDTNKTHVSSTLVSTPPPVGSTVFGLDLNTTGSYQFGLRNFAAHTPFGDVFNTGNSLYFADSLASTTSLIDVDRGDVLEGEIAPGLTGFLTAPTLPQLTVSAGGTGTGALTTASGSDTAPNFGQLDFNPVGLIPVLGEINHYSDRLIESYLLDVIVDYTIIDLTIHAGVAMKQETKITITGVDATATVQEKDANGNYLAPVNYSGAIGSVLELKFSEGDRTGTIVTEGYTVHVHADSSVYLDFNAAVSLGLLHFIGIFNPKGVPEQKIDETLWSTNLPFDIAAVKIGEQGFDFDIVVPATTYVIDTHIPISGDDVGRVHQMSLGQIGFDAKGGNDTVQGNASDNQILGGAGDDIVNGNTGKDVIHGGTGGDDLRGNDGDDQLYTDEGGGQAIEKLWGQDGNDQLYAGASFGRYDGGAGDDSIIVRMSTFGGQTIIGGDGVDYMLADFGDFTNNLTFNLSSTNGSGTLVQEASYNGIIFVNKSTYTGIEKFGLRGGSGNDAFTGSGNQDFFEGGKGDDTLYGGGGNDRLQGQEGNDIVDGGIGNDFAGGGDGNDIVRGGDGADGLYGESGDDVINAGTGQDYANGGDGADTINDGSGDVDNDSFFGGSGDDTITAGGGHDKLSGDSGNDVLRAAGSGSDLDGGEGDDKLYAISNSLLIGGRGSDTIYAQNGSNLTINGDDQFASPDPGDVDRLVLNATTRVIASATPTDYVFADHYRSQASFYKSAGTLTGNSTYSGIEAFSVYGVAADDAIVTGSGDDVIRGLGGNDYLDGGLGVDLLDGGSGNDALVGGLGDQIYGGTGTDTFYFRAPRQPFAGPVAGINIDVGAGDIATPIGSGSGGGSGGPFDIPNLGLFTPGQGGGTGGLLLSSVERMVMLGANGGNDTISGGIGGDVLLGGKGNDTLSGNNGDDQLDGGDGFDTLLGGDGDDLLNLRDYTSVPTTGGYRTRGDTASGGAGDDIIYATNTAILLRGGTGNDTITLDDGGNLGDFRSEIYGEGGNDVITGSNRGEYIEGGFDETRADPAQLDGLDLSESDNDYIASGGGDDEVYGGYGNDQIDVGTGRDFAYGGSGDDTISGDAYDKIYGDSGDDRLYRYGGVVPPVTSSGGTRPTVDSMLLDGGDGIDLAGFDFSGSNVALKFTLNEGTTVVEPTLTLSSIEKIDAVLSDKADTVTGGGLSDVIAGGKGADIIHGGGGDDRISGNGGSKGTDAGGDKLYGDDGDDRIVVDAAALASGGTGVDILQVYGLNASFANAVFSTAAAGGSFGSISYLNMERLNYYADIAGPAVQVTGGVYADELAGTNGADRLDGLKGDDSLYGFGGSDVLLVSGIVEQAYLDGGEGDDLAVINLATSTADIRIQQTPTGNGDDGYTRPVTMTGIERINVTTGSGKDYVTGGAGNDFITTGEGNDFVNGQGGTDVINLGGGADTVYDHYSGIDTINGGTGGDVIDLGGQTAIVHGDADNDIIRVSEAFTGGAGDTPDWLYGDAGDDLIDSNSYGRFDGGIGNDRIVNNLSRAGAVDLFLAKGGQVDIATGWSLNGFEEYFLTLGSGDDRLEVDYGVHNLNGGAGFDRLVIRTDAPLSPVVTTGAGGAKTYTFANGMVVTGFEQIDYYYYPQTKFGSTFNDSLKGGYGDDRLYGGDGNDILDGGFGKDTMYGGKGDDTFYVDNPDDSVIENADEGVDRVLSTVSYTLSDNVEQLTLTGEPRGGIVRTATGNGLDNVISGGFSDDKLYGLGGADILRGGGGNDTLDGGEGADNLQGGAGADTMTGGAGADRFTFAGGDTPATITATDTIRDFSRVQGDKIVLNGIDADINLRGDQAFTFIGASVFHGAAGELRTLYAQGYTYVQGDVDGDGQADFTIRVTGNPGLVATDFVL